MEPTKTAENGSPSKPRGQLGDPLAQLGAGLQGLASSDSIEALRERIDLPKRMRSNPYGTLAIALGAGYLLGGGLFSSLTRRLLGAGLKMGLRVGAIALVEQQLSQLARGTSDRGNSNHTNSQGAQQ